MHVFRSRGAGAIRPRSELLPSGILQDLRYGVRAPRRNPGFTAVVAASLVIGMTASVAIYAVLDAVVLRPLPVRQAALGLHVVQLPAFPSRSRRPERWAGLQMPMNKAWNPDGSRHA